MTGKNQSTMTKRVCEQLVLTDAAPVPANTESLVSLIKSIDEAVTATMSSLHATIATIRQDPGCGEDSKSAGPSDLIGILYSVQRKAQINLELAGNLVNKVGQLR